MKNKTLHLGNLELFPLYDIEDCFNYAKKIGKRAFNKYDEIKFYFAGSEYSIIKEEKFIVEQKILFEL